MEAGALPAAPAVSNDAVEALFRMVLHALVRAVAVFGTAALMGGLLFYTWPSFAARFSFLRAAPDYWTYVLVALGAYAAYYIYQQARDRSTLSLDGLFESPGSTLAKAVTAAIEPGLLLLLAWLIVEYIQ